MDTKALFLASFLCLFSSIHTEEFPQIPEEEEAAIAISDLEEEPHALVHGVHVITGDYTEQGIDLSFGGVEPLQVRRSYSSSSKRKEATMGWEFNHRGYLIDNSSRPRHLYEFRDEKGLLLIFQRAKKEHQNYPFRIDSYLFAFSKGYMHFPYPGCNPPHPYAAHMICRESLSENVVVAGNKDRYQFIKRHKDKALIKAIQRQNGLTLSYTYDEHGILDRVDLHNKRKETIQSLFWKYENHAGCTVSNSEGSSVTYQWKKHSSLEVSGSGIPSQTYLYDREDKLIRRVGPEGTLEIEYDKQGRVKELREPVGSEGKLAAIYRFSYDASKKVTRVVDALGIQTLYHYGEDARLSCIEHYDEKKKLYSRESFSWTFDGELLTRAFEDGEGILQFVRAYAYDDRGNVICEALYGNLTGKNKIAPALNKKGLPKENGCEVYRKQYRYAHNLLVEEGDERKKTRYQYHAESNLIKAKYIYEGKAIRLRHFYDYDHNGCLALEMVDDGNQEGEENLSGVTERHVTRYQNRLKSPVGLPEVVEEFVLDLSIGQEQLVSARHHLYNAQGHLIRQEHYDSAQKLAYTLSWEYDANGNIVKETDALGQVTERAFDACGNVVRLIGPDPNLTVEYSYDPCNRLIREESVADGNRLVKSCTYDKRGQKKGSTDIYGAETHFSYDAFGRLVETYFPDRTQEKNIYNTQGHLICRTRADGSETRYERNVRGQPALIIYANGTTEHFEYALDGHLIRKTSVLGQATQYSYDYQGRCIRKETPLKTELFAYNAFHFMNKSDSHGNQTGYRYDCFGRLSKIVDGEKETIYEYDSLGRCWKIIQNEIVKENCYDLLDRVIEDMTDKDKVQYAYDSAGRRTQTITKQGVFTTLYNALGDPVVVTDTEGNKTENHYFYDHGMPYCESIDGEGTKTLATRDACGRLIRLERVSDCLHQIKTFAYDSLGRMCLSRMEGSDKKMETRWRYDAAGNIVSLIEQGRETCSFYNAKGLLEKVVKPDGVTLHYSYDDLGRLTDLVSSDQTVHQRYSYDAADNMVQMEDLIRQLTVGKKYDHWNRCVEEDFGNALVIKTSYDPHDRKVSLTLPDQSSVRTIYAGMKIAQVQRFSSDGVFLYQYSQEQEDHATLVGKAGSLHINRNQAGRPIEIASPYWRAKYQYDHKGLLTQRHIGEAPTDYTYDSLDQLCEEKGDVNSTYKYDQLYNRLNPDDPVYDLVGRLSRRMFEGRLQTYAYDACDRLIRVDDANGRQYAYVYDNEGRRLSKTIHRNGEQETYYYLYSGPYEIACYRKDEMQELRLLGTGLGGDVGAAVAMEIEGQVYAPIHDLSGSIVNLIASQTGESAGLTSYTAFGEVMERQGVRSPWGFASKRCDPETGFVYFGKRFYDPLSGCFITPDPIGAEGGPNLYAYLLNNPLTHFDREGLFLESIGAFLHDSMHFLGHSFSLLGDHILPIPYLRDIFSSIGHFFCGGSALVSHPRSYNGDLGKPELASKVRIVTSNGILHDPASNLAWNEAISSNFGGSNVHYHYNSSHGFVMDMLECIAQKLGFHTHSDEKLVQLLREQCAEVGADGQVHLIAHSQGGQNAANALAHLDVSERSIIHVVTLGSASIINPRSGVGFVKNYINSGDPVPWFSDPGGILRYGGSVEFMRSPLLDHGIMTSHTYMNAIKRYADLVKGRVK